MKNVLSRINARKIVLSYLYQQCFFSKLKIQDSVMSEILSLDNIFESDKEEYKEEKKCFIEQISQYFEKDLDYEIDYFVNFFFDKRKVEDIDVEYIFSIIRTYTNYMDDISKKVDSHTETFSFDDLNVITQCLFLLAYTEWKELKTPEHIIINEMVELSKRFDDGSTKLLNAVLHKIMIDS